MTLDEIDRIPSQVSKAAVVSYYVKRMQRDDGNAIHLTADLFHEFLGRDLPIASEQADNFILWVGDRTQPGERWLFNPSHSFPEIGANFAPGLAYIVHSLKEAKLLEPFSNDAQACLSFAGWNKYQDLKRGKSDTKKAFMAMPFGNNELDRVFVELKSAVSKTGFNLTRLDEKPEAGLIDNRLRVEIRTSRFVVADLTYGNHGAYWEAGFAEGLGKHVFYTCGKSYFAEKRTHFDASHLYTVLWEEQNMHKATEELKLAIRVTLPDEAKMTDG
jgi:hypothetical protein